MKTAAILSPEQDKAKALYKSAYGSALVVTMLLGVALLVAIEQILRHLGWIISSSSGEGGLVPISAILAAHHWAVRQVRRAGLSQEDTSVEVVTNTATGFSGATVEWWYPKTTMGKIGMALIPFLLSAAGWSLWYASGSPLHYVLGAVGFIFFATVGILNLAFIGSPQVKIDEQGVVGFQNSWWPRRALWRDIAHCEMKRVKSFSGESRSWWLTFKDDKEKVLLVLKPSSLQGLKVGELQEIEAEIKRRMDGHPDTSVAQIG